MMAHDGDDQGIVVQQAGLLADSGSYIDECRGGVDHLDAIAGDFLKSCAELLESLDLGGMVPESNGDAGLRPAKRPHRFEGHQSMGHLAQHVRGRESGQLLMFNPLRRSVHAAP